MGWNGSDGKRAGRATIKQSSPQRKKPTRIALLATFAAVIVGCILVVFFIKTEAPQKTTDKPKHSNAISDTNSAAHHPKVVSSRQAAKKDAAFEDQSGVRSAENVKKTDNKLPPVIDTSEITGADQMLDALAVQFEGTRGHIQPPMPVGPHTEEMFKRSLEIPVVISESDSNELKKMKERILAMREEVKTLLSEGKSIREILNEHQEFTNQEADMRLEAMNGLKELEQAGDEQGAAEYKEKINAALTQMGYEPIRASSMGKDRILQLKERRELRRRQLEEDVE